MSMNRMRRSVVVLAAALAVNGCAKSDDSSSSIPDQVSDAVETGVTTIGGLADEQSSGGFATAPLNRAERLALWLEGLAVPRAHALVACSGRAVDDSTCSSGARTASYSGCTLGTSTATLTGNVTLTYSDPVGCDINSVGEYVTRTYDLTVTGPRGGTLKRFTANHTDYTGATVGGGGVLTRGNAGWTIDVLGNTTTIDVSGVKIVDISVKTTSQMNVTGAISRTGRTLSGGTLEVRHNIAQFTAAFSPSNVTWSSGCCYPTGGSMSVAVSGSRTGSYTVAFSSSCGSATISDGTNSKTVTLQNCE